MVKVAAFLLAGSLVAGCGTGQLIRINTLWLDNGTPRERYEAAVYLGSRGPAAKDSVPTLVAVLKTSGDGDIRAQVATTLGQIGPDAKEALPALNAALVDRSILVRNAAEGAISLITPGSYRRKPGKKFDPGVAPMVAPAAATSVIPAARTVPAGQVPNVAVSDLEATGVSASSAVVVTDWVRGELVRDGMINVVERKNMEKILAEAAFQQSGCTNQECAVRLGKLLNANVIVVGGLGVLFGSHVINIRAVDVETGKVFYSDTARGKDVDEIQAAVIAMARRLAERIR
jgi:hypothetical protein